MTDEPAFILVECTKPGDALQMTIPRGQFVRALADFAAVMPPDMTWTARPVDQIDLHKIAAQ